MKLAYVFAPIIALTACSVDPIVSKERIELNQSQISAIKANLSNDGAVSFDKLYGMKITRENSVNTIACGRFGGESGFIFALRLEDGNRLSVPVDSSNWIANDHSDAGGINVRCGGEIIWN